MFKPFFLKNSYKVISFLTAALMAGFLFYVPPVQAIDLGSPAPDGPCFGITGQGKKVLIDGIANSGVTHFDSDPDGLMGVAPALLPVGPIYKACVVDPDSNPDNGVEIHGWAWNDNLGWISLYCPAGAGATNEGVACSGAFQGGYGVTIDKDGKFSGHAWSDNAGWIQFDNSGDPAHAQVKIETTPDACTGFVYSDAKPDAVCPAHTKATTMAWSDAVGWVDFDGINVPWSSVVKDIDPRFNPDPKNHPEDGGINVTLTPDPSAINKKTAPLADGNGQYVLNVHIQNKKGDPIVPDVAPHFYIVKVNADWTDTMKKDQTDPSDPILECPKADGVDTKPCVGVPYINNGDYAGPVKAVAPTSNMNFWDGNDNGVQDGDDFSYETFALPSDKPAVPASTLKLNQVLLSVFDKTSNSCVLGTPVDCAPLAYSPIYADPAHPELKFRPKTEVTKLEDPKGNNKFIEISSGPLLPFAKEVVGDPNDKVTYYSGIEPAPPMGSFDFLFDSDLDGKLLLGTDASTFGPVAPNADPLMVGVAVKKDDKGNPVLVPPQYIPGEYIYTVVEDPMTGVKYFSNKLPKAKGSIAVQPVVVLRGNVYSSGATATTSFQAVRSLGDVSTNALRDTVFRNVSKIIAGGGKADVPGVATLGADISGGFKTLSGQVKAFLPDENGVPKVYVHYGDLVLGSLMGNAGNISWKGERTIVVIGGSVKINANLVADAPMAGAPKPKLGIIVLKDLKDVMKQDLQGHIYVGPTVSHLQANIFADGAVFPANATWTTNPMNGEPVFGSIAEMENLLKHYQLMIEGSIASQNTIGGSLKSVTGSGANADNDLQARLYDLNFLRNYTGWVKRNPMTKDAECPMGVDPNDPKAYVKDTDGTPNTVYAPDMGGCLYSPVIDALGDGEYFSVFTTDTDKQHNLGATYIYFDPPSPTLPGFSAGLGGNQKQLPQ